MCCASSSKLKRTNCANATHVALAIVTQAEALASLLNGSGVCAFLGCAAPPTAGEAQWRRLANVAGLTGSVCSYGSGSAGSGSASCVTSGPPYAASLRSGVVSVLSPDGFMQTTSLSDAAVAQGTRAGAAGWSASQMGNLALDNTWCVCVRCTVCLLSACVGYCVQYFLPYLMSLALLSAAILCCLA